MDEDSIQANLISGSSGTKDRIIQQDKDQIQQKQNEENVQLNISDQGVNSQENNQNYNDFQIRASRKAIGQQYSQSEINYKDDSSNNIAEKGSINQSFKQPNKQDKLYTLEEIFAYMGIGAYQYLAMLYTALCLAAFGGSLFVNYTMAQFALCDLQDVPASAVQYPAMIFFLGQTFGSFLLGYVADYIGRKSCILLAFAIIFTFSCLSAAPRHYTALIVLRFFVGFGCGGMPIPFTFLFEQLFSKSRSFIMIIITSGMFIGEIFIGVMQLAVLPQYGPEAWRWLLLLSAAPFIIAIPGQLFFYETPRWLVQAGKLEKAREALIFIGKINGRPLPQEMLNNIDLSKLILNKGQGNSLGQIIQKIGQDYRLFGKIIRHPKMLISFLIMLVVWFAAGLIYYGMSQVPTVLRGGKSEPFKCDRQSHQIMSQRADYTELIYQSLSNYAGVAFIIPFVMLLTRRQAYTIFQSLLFTSLLVQAIITSQKYVTQPKYGVAETALQYISRDLSSASQLLIYVYTPEIFPTPIRSQCMGLCSALCRIGQVVSPVIVVYLIQQGLASATFSILAGFSFLSAILINFVPIETKGKVLNEQEFLKTHRKLKVDKKVLEEPSNHNTQKQST